MASTGDTSTLPGLHSIGQPLPEPGLGVGATAAWLDLTSPCWPWDITAPLLGMPSWVQADRNVDLRLGVAGESLGQEPCLQWGQGWGLLAHRQEAAPIHSPTCWR